jgi:peptide/nickel transport system substrate-binding protein
MEHFRWESGEVEPNNIDRFDSIVTGGREGLFSGMWSGRFHLINAPGNYRMVKKKAESLGLYFDKIGAALWNVWYLNCQMPPFDDIRVRKAVAHAINAEECANFFGEGAGIAYPSNAAWESKSAQRNARPDMPMSGMRGGLDLSERVYPYDPEKSRKLLAEAGYPKGFDAGKMIALAGGTMAIPPQVIQGQLKKVGIKYDIEFRDWVSFIEHQRSGRNPMSDYHCSRFPDAWFYMQEFLHSDSLGHNNFARWSNDKFDSLLDNAAKERDQDKRNKMLCEAQLIALEDAVAVPLYRWFIGGVRSKHVDLGYELAPGGWVDGHFVCEKTKWKTEI